MMNLSEGLLFLTGKTGTEFRSLFEKASVLSSSEKRVSILLFGDGVNSGVKESELFKSLGPSSKRILLYACREDVESRGLGSRLDLSIKLLGYDEIVDLFMLNDDKVVSYV